MENYRIYDYQMKRFEELASRLELNAYTITIRTRRADIMESRQTLWWYLREHEHWTHLEISRLTGFNHSTIISGVRKVARLLEINDPKISELVKRVSCE